MKILITGNMGYVGPVLTAHLRRRFPDAILVGYDAGFFAHCLSVHDRFPETALDWQIFGDVRDLQPRVLEGVDAVVHLAAISNDPMGVRFEAVTEEINHRASAALALKARDAGVKTFVFASSCSIYGFAEGGPRKETDPLNPLTAYARSKIGTEESLRSMDLGSMRAVVLRFATACGMSPRLRLDLVLNDFVACAVSSGEITVLSDGTPWRPLIDVEDMARAIEWAITDSRSVADRVFSVNVGAQGWNYRVKDLAEAVAAVIPGTSVHINTLAPPDKRSYQVDFSLYEFVAPCHQPHVTLQQSIKRLRDGLSAIGFSDHDFRNSQFIRLRVLEQQVETNYLSHSLQRPESSRQGVAA
jgi:nucleoside-diphosphate-sugar epimerase